MVLLNFTICCYISDLHLLLHFVCEIFTINALLSAWKNAGSLWTITEHSWPWITFISFVFSTLSNSSPLIKYLHWPWNSFIWTSFSLVCSSDIAWRNANYAQVWEYLRDEYELSQRFENLNFKLKFVEVNLSCFYHFYILLDLTANSIIHLFLFPPSCSNCLLLVQHNISLIQEILQNRTFVLLEWLIIFLIALDIVLSYLLHWKKVLLLPQPDQGLKLFSLDG